MAISLLLPARFLILASLGLSSCCGLKGPCTNVESSPTIRWVDDKGDIIQLGSAGLDVTSVRNLLFEVDGVQWAVEDNFGGSIQVGDGERVLVITDAGEVGSLPDNGERRKNVVAVTYTFNSNEYTDTLFYDSYLDEKNCCSISRVEPVERVNGPIVKGFYTTQDIPGIKIIIER